MINNSTIFLDSINYNTRNNTYTLNFMIIVLSEVLIDLIATKEDHESQKLKSDWWNIFVSPSSSSYLCHIWHALSQNNLITQVAMYSCPVMQAVTISNPVASSTCMTWWKRSGIGLQTWSRPGFFIRWWRFSGRFMWSVGRGKTEGKKSVIVSWAMLTA